MLDIAIDRLPSHEVRLAVVVCIGAIDLGDPATLSRCLGMVLF
jgi:hypothetical protein